MRAIGTWLTVFGLALGGAGCLETCDGGSASSGGTGPFQAALDDAVGQGLPGAILVVQGAGLDVRIASGVAERTSCEPMTPDHAFRVASNSKTYLAVLLARLHVAGAVDLDSRAAPHLPAWARVGIDNAAQATTRQLLTHTSGIFDYLDTNGFWNATRADPSRVWTPGDALAYAVGRRAYFAPGRGWEYSNSNYLLAGLVADAVLGRHHADAFRDEIFEPLGLTRTAYEHHHPIPEPLAHGYADHIGGPGLDDTYAYDHGYGLADGGIVTTAEELARFLRAVALGDELLTGAERAEVLSSWVRTGPRERYGLGIAEIDTRAGLAYGHGGGLVGYLSEMFVFPDRDLVVVILANGSDGLLDRVFEDLVEDVLAELP